MAGREKSKGESEFLIDAYKVRAELHNQHTTRMWFRYNILLVAETTLLGFFLKTWIENPTSNSGSFLLLGLGLFLSLIWYILAAQDRYYFEGFRAQIQALEDRITKLLNIENFDKFTFGKPTDVTEDFLTWRLKTLSLSRLVSASPVLFFLLWLVFLLSGVITVL